MYLSPKKQRFVNYIQSFTSNSGRPPTFVEIMDGLGIRSLGTINWYVTELEKEGVIKRMRGPNGKRALSVLEQKLKITLPLLGIVQAGYPLDVFETDERIEVPPVYAKTGNYVLRVHGESMLGDHIMEGDHIIVKDSQTAVNGELVIAYVNNEATLKRYHPEKDHIKLRPSNPAFDIIRVQPDDDFRIGGIVLAVMRHFS